MMLILCIVIPDVYLGCIWETDNIVRFPNAALIPRSEPHGAVHRQSIQPAGGVVVRGCCLLQDPRIKISIENNQRAPADMVLQLRRNIGPGWCPEQFIVTDTVYSRRSRIDADSGFQSGLKYLLTQGIHQTDFQRLRAGIKPGRFSIGA